MFRNVHCALLFAHLLNAVVMDGAEENNLCALVHCAYDGKEELHLSIAGWLLITRQ